MQQKLKLLRWNSNYLSSEVQCQNTNDACSTVPHLPVWEALVISSILKPKDVNQNNSKYFRRKSIIKWKIQFNIIDYFFLKIARVKTQHLFTISDFTHFNLCLLETQVFFVPHFHKNLWKLGFFPLIDSFRYVVTKWPFIWMKFLFT